MQSKIVIPANPKRLAYEERKKQKNEKPAPSNPTLKEVYAAQQELFDILDYIIELLKSRA